MLAVGCSRDISNFCVPEPAGWVVNAKLMEKYQVTEQDLSRPLDELEGVFRKRWKSV